MRQWGRRGIWAHKNTAKKLEALEPLEVKRIAVFERETKEPWIKFRCWMLRKN